MPFDYLHSNVPKCYRRADEKAESMYLAELEDRAGLLYRLHYEKEEAKRRLRGNVRWDWECSPSPEYVKRLEDSVEEIVERIFSQQVFNTYGPFVEVDVDGHPLGSVHTDTDGSVGLHIRIQSPLWFDVARIEIYANGELVREIDNAFGSLEPGEHLDNSRIVNYDHRIELDGLDEDTWFVVLVMGPDNLSPVFTANEFPYIQIGNLISMALSSESFEAIIGDILAECDEQGLHKTWWSLIICLIFEAIGEMENPSEIIEDLLAGLLPKSPSSIFPIHPYAQTNAIFVDVDGNGGYDPPLLAFDRSDGTPGGDEALNPLAQYMSNPAVLKRMARIFASMPQQSTYRIR